MLDISGIGLSNTGTVHVTEQYMHTVQYLTPEQLSLL